MNDRILEVQDLSLDIGALKVLSDINLSVKSGTIHSIIGPNGAGKSSLINCINGFYPNYQGKILFKQKQLPRKPSVVAERGIARVFQEVELFTDLTVLENIMLGRHLKLSYHLFHAMLFYGKTRKIEKEQRRFCELISEKVGLQEILDQPVEELPYGIQKKVELARALVMEPELVLLDEPMAGMTKKEKKEITSVLLDIRKTMDLTMLIIEHDLNIVMDISDTITVLNFGEKIAEGLAEEVQNDQKVIEAYIGTE